MTTVAFYAPMKPANNPRPSGDRQLARLFVLALRRAGCSVIPAALLRSWDGTGDSARQQAFVVRGQRIADALVRRWRSHPPDVWFTYHLYHKAPDCIGPSVCRELGIPYVVAEASVGDKQRGGPWHDGYAASVEALRMAAAVVCLNPGDREALLRYCSPDRIHALRPFCEAPPMAQRHSDAEQRVPSLIAVGMMRGGDKFESYRQLAQVLEAVADLPWELTVVGDGRKRCAVMRLFDSVAQRVSFLGARSPQATLQALSRSDLCVWPAHNEALGMALLEAQVCGVPVVAGRSPGVASVVEHGVTGLLTEPGDVSAMSDAVRGLLDDPQRRASLARAALTLSRSRHGLDAAAGALGAILAACAKAT